MLLVFSRIWVCDLVTAGGALGVFNLLQEQQVQVTGLTTYLDQPAHQQFFSAQASRTTAAIAHLQFPSLQQTNAAATLLHNNNITFQFDLQHYFCLMALEQQTALGVTSDRSQLRNNDIIY